MFRIASLGLMVLAVSCSPPPQGVPTVGHPIPPPTASSPAAAPTPAAVAPPPVPSAPLQAPRAFRQERGGISFSGISFDSRDHRLRVADQPGGPGSQWSGAREAAAAMGGIAAVNAGFFTPEGQPLGLLLAAGEKRGALNRSSSLGAGFYLDAGRPALVRRQAWTGQAREALQSGPFLVEGGKAVGGLSQATSTARTFIACDGGSRWLLVRTGSCSLAELGAALAGGSLGGVEIVTALNLDGGRSSDLWIAPAVQGGPVHERPLWNKPVRNFLVLVPRT